MHVSHAAVCLRTRHLTEQECQEIWCFGTNGKTFLNAVSEARVAQIARSYGCTPLAAWLLDCVFTGLLHPPGFKCLPTANASSAQAEERHHLMIERMVAISEAGLWGAEVHV